MPEINDIAFVGVEHPEHGPGFDLWVGGGLSTNPMLAVRLGAWVPEEEVAEVWAGVVGVFRDYGYRRLRTRARIKFLVADWGPEKFREVLENEYLKRPLIDGPAPATPTSPGDHVGVNRQKDGRFYVGLSAIAGRVSGSQLVELADLAEAHGSTGCAPRRCRRSWCSTSPATRSTPWSPAPRRSACRPGRTPGGAR